MIESMLPIPLAMQPEEREIIEPRSKLTVSQWAEKYRTLSRKTSKYPGNWSHEFTPFLVEIMDSLSDINTREVWAQKCAQFAATEAGNNWIGQTIDEEPGPMVILMPDEAIAKKRLRTRIKPMFEDNPRLLRHLTNSDIKQLRVGQETELDNMFLHIAWAGSAAAMSDFAAQKVLIDEAAKCVGDVGQEAGAYDLIRDRQTTFSNTSKLFAPSTPITKGDPFDVEFEETDKRQWWIKCVFCGQRHIPRWAYVELDKNSVGGLLSSKDYASGHCSRYVCPICEKRWDEMKRWNAVTAGKWAPRDCKVDPDGRIIGKVFSNPHRGYDGSALMLYPGFMTMAKLAAEWAKADKAWKAGDYKPKQNFMNSRMGDSWEIKEKETAEGVITLHKGSYEPERAPVGVQFISVGMDVQIDHVWYLVLGWGYQSELWVLSEGRLETGDTAELANYKIVSDFLHSPIADFDGVVRSINIAAIDCNYRTEVVKAFCRQLNGLIPVRGDATVTTRNYREMKDSSKRLDRYDLNVDAYKDTLYYHLYEAKTPGPGYMHLHKKFSPDSISQLASEEKVTKRVKGKTRKMWEPKGEHVANHLWDCSVYAYFAGEVAGAKFLGPWKVPEAKKDVNVKKVITKNPIKTKY